MAVYADRDAVEDAYEDVRNDKSDTNWCALKYDDKKVVLDSTGIDFEEFKGKFGDDERVFGFLRVMTGDEMSKRMKFAFISWVGPKVSPLQRARMSTDKSEVKKVIQSFAKEMLIDEERDICEDKIREELVKAGGANYGTGSH